jgi:hypothetical protein
MKFYRVTDRHTNVFILPGVLNIQEPSRLRIMFHSWYLVKCCLALCVYGHTEDNVSQLVFGEVLFGTVCVWT